MNMYEKRAVIIDDRHRIERLHYIIIHTHVTCIGNIRIKELSVASSISCKYIYYVCAAARREILSAARICVAYELSQNFHF